MIRKLSAALLLAAAVAAQAAPVSAPYTFDYFVHATSGPKPVLVFGTGKTTFIQLEEGVQVQQVVARKGNSEKFAEVVYSAPYTVVKEIHDSLKVSTNKGEFTVERTGAKTEVELAAERAEAARAERNAAEARAKEQAAEISRLREEIKKQKDVVLKAEEAKKAAAAQQLTQDSKKVAGGAAAAVQPPAAQLAENGETRVAGESPVTLRGANKEAPPVLAAIAAPSATVVALPSGAANESTPARTAPPVGHAVAKEKAGTTRVTFFIRNGEGLRSALARDAQKLGMNVSWSLREDRVASRDMTFAGDTRDAVLNDILVAFRLPGYLVKSTNTLYIVKDEK